MGRVLAGSFSDGAGLEAELRGDFLGRPEPAAAEPFPFPFEVAG